MKEGEIIKNWIGFRCPFCGKYVSDIKLIVDRVDNIKRVIATCNTHGLVNVSNTADWWYEDFYGWDDSIHADKEGDLSPSI